MCYRNAWHEAGPLRMPRRLGWRPAVAALRSATLRIPLGYTRTARTGRSNQVASLWAAMPKSTNNYHFGYQNELLKPESDRALLEPPWVLFLAPKQVAQPLWRWHSSLFTRSDCI